jgi:acetoin utilization deacetylase AcuC-like enzyme
MGFCLFNNVALGARYLKERYSVKRVMIVDIDLHHGNGIQKAFYDSDEVLYVSMHHFPCYPGTGNFGEVGIGRGEGFTVNIPLGKGQGDEELARIVFFLVNPLAQAYKPEMILVLWFRSLHEGPSAAMRVTPEGMA